MATGRRSKRRPPPASGDAQEVVETTGALLRVLASLARARDALSSRQDGIDEEMQFIASTPDVRRAFKDIRVAAHSLSATLADLPMQVRVARVSREILTEAGVRFGARRHVEPTEQALDEFTAWVSTCCNKHGLSEVRTKASFKDVARAALRAPRVRREQRRGSSDEHRSRELTREERVARAVCEVFGLDLSPTTILELDRMLVSKKARRAGRLKTPAQAHVIGRHEFAYDGRDGLELAILATLGEGWTPSREEIAEATQAAWETLFRRS